MSDEETVITVRGLTNRFGEQVVHEDLDLDVLRGEILGVVGGSGTGKSVLMRSIIGLQRPEAGEVEVFGEPMIDRDEGEAEAIRRRWGVLFQGGALFSTLTVAENVEVPLREYYPQLGEELLDEIASYKIVMSGLPADAAPKYPSELSGGMRKRVGIARALAQEPEMLLFDEPTAGLDPTNSRMVADLIVQLRGGVCDTAVVVTHDVELTKTVADRVAILIDGRFAALGPRDEVLASTEPAVQAFLAGEAKVTT